MLATRAPQVSARAATVLLSRRTSSTLAMPAMASASNWSNRLPFASPESDFASQSPQSRSKSTVSASASNTSISWSNGFSYASPESDSVSQQAQSNSLISASAVNNQPSWSKSVSFASPESDFTGNASFLTQAQGQHKSANIHVSSSSEWSNALSFASPESDFTSAVVGMTARESSPALPRTFKEALQRYTDKALVITTATHPHTVVYVNETWEKLCGYERQTILHKPIGSLLQGPKTNTKVAKSMTKQVLSSYKSPMASQHIDAYLVNYKASGDSFINHITAGPLYIEEEDSRQHIIPHFFVGILDEVSSDRVPLKLAV
eukprot:CAMPEP_0198139660 /NCGR_PEP_ID=MMETSP1443-20131203/2935_1 /TAXON_ID=186043 /ORGANISM="Entomoneis sp., Strain CCMP2396" /LENGTH=319 /DNA_ID=CAMNT_0043801859 /DNA_START=150 /DNA_END=1109 /DNA_ORIENTATION=-